MYIKAYIDILCKYLGDWCRNIANIDLHFRVQRLLYHSRFSRLSRISEAASNFRFRVIFEAIRMSARDWAARKLERWIER